MNLYSFSKKSWHVKFFQFLFNEDPTKRYKTMCPYFWTYVIIFTFLPLILIIRMFGKVGVKFLSWLKDYKENKENKEIAHLKKICDNPNLTPKEGYDIIESKCWDSHSWMIIETARKRIWSLYYTHRDSLDMLKNLKLREKIANREKTVQKYEAYKEQRCFTYTSYLITAILGGVILYAMCTTCLYLVSIIPWGSIWNFIWTLPVIMAIWTLPVIMSALTILSFYLFFKYVVVSFFRWLSCVKLPRCGMCETLGSFFSIFKYIWMPFKYTFIGFVKVILIIGDMIYVTYKKQCPIITWEDENLTK